MKNILITLLVFLTACTSPSTPPAPHLIKIQHTSSTQAWLPELFSCESKADVAISIETRAADFFDSSSQLSMRLGEPDEISTHAAYEIGTEEIVVVIHPENPLQSLTLSDLRAIFSGEIQNWADLGGDDIPIQAWTFSPGEDIRKIFDSIVMLQQPISSQARLAVSADSMVAGVGFDPGAIGFLPHSLVNADIHIAYIEDMPSSIIAPVLVLTSPDADQTAITLVSCMQNK